MSAVGIFNCLYTIRERQREGIALAKKHGIYKGRKRSLTPDQVLLLKQRIFEKASKSQVAREFEISRQTLYEYLKRDNS